MIIIPYSHILFVLLVLKHEYILVLKQLSFVRITYATLLIDSVTDYPMLLTYNLYLIPVNLDL